MPLLLSFLLLLLAGGPIPAAAQVPTQGPIEMPKHYQAQMVTTTPGGRTNNITVYCNGKNMRSEVEAEGLSMITITRADRKAIYNLMPSQKSYFVIPFKEKEIRALKEELKPKIEWRREGQETLNGRLCDKYILASELHGSEGPTHSSTVYYIDASTKRPVRIIAGSGQQQSITDYVQITEVEPPAALFEVPAGYTKIQMPNLVLPNGAGGAPAAQPAETAR